MSFGIVNLLLIAEFFAAINNNELNVKNRPLVQSTLWSIVDFSCDSGSISPSSGSPVGTDVVIDAVR